MKYILDENNIIIGLSIEAEGDDYNIVNPDDVVYGLDKIIDGRYYSLSDNRGSN